jgi:Tfp pilus assembly protein PilX
MGLMVNGRQQLGSILILTLLMLVFLQYVAIAVVNSTNISSQIINNFQLGQRLKKNANSAIDIVINNKDHFANYSKYLNAEGDFYTNLTAITASGYSAKIISFECLDLAPLESNLDCDLTNQYWQLKLQVENSITSAKIDLVQGVKLTRLIGAIDNGSQNFSTERLWWYSF